MQPKLTAFVVVITATIALVAGYLLTAVQPPQPATPKVGAMIAFRDGQQFIMWKNGSESPWPHRHQRILTEPDDIEATRLRYGLPSFPPPCLVVFESVDDNLRVIAVHSLNDGKLLWERTPLWQK